MPSNHLILCHPLLPCLQSFLASGSFQMSQFFTSGGQSIGASASASVLSMNIQDWSPLGWTGWTSLQSQGTLKSLLQHHSSKASILRCSPLRCINIALYKFYSFSFFFIFLNSVWPYKKSILHQYPLRDQRVKTPALVPMYDNDDFKLTITGL